MSHVIVELDIPEDLERFKLPPGVDDRLQELLDRQDRGGTLTPSEKREAEGLVNLAETYPFFVCVRRERSSSPPPK